MTTRRRLFALALALLAAGVGPVATRAGEQANTLQANTLMDLRRVIGACLDGAPIAAGSRVTIAFMMKRDGSIFGRPRITYAHLDGDADAQGRFLAEVERAVNSCLPVRVTPALGAAIAGRMFTITLGRKRTEPPRA